MTKLLWLGLYPSHYMSNFNVKINEKYNDIFFIYLKNKYKYYRFYA